MRRWYFILCCLLPELFQARCKVIEIGNTILPSSVIISTSPTQRKTQSTIQQRHITIATPSQQHHQLNVSVVSKSDNGIIASSASNYSRVNTDAVHRNCNSKDNRICERFSSPACATILGLTNQSTVSRDCRYGDQESETQLQKLFTYLSERNSNKKCLDLSKWFLCGLIYPSCNTSSDGSLIKPCEESCDAVMETCDHKLRKKVSNFNSTFYEERVKLLDCVSLEEKGQEDKKDKCLFKLLEGEMTKVDPPLHRFGTIIVIGAVAGGVFIFILVASICFIYKKKKEKSIVRSLSLHEVKEVHGNRTIQAIDNLENLGIVNPKYDSVTSMVGILGIQVFGKENLIFDQNLGEGAFGKVVKCKTKNIRHSMSDENMVAVKYLKENAESEMELTFQKELEILSNFNHPNVIPLVGVCLDKAGPMCLILEFMKYGDLNQYIRLRSGSFHAVAGSCGNLPDGVEFQSPELSYHNLLSIIAQIADGIGYLASKRFVHRDLATRNILVGDNLRVKISDFGLAHDIYGSDYYRVSSQKLLPLRWLSPEALSLGRFTIYSDIFAFGVTMWEIFTYGMQPYYGCNNEEVCNKIRGHKLPERPYMCPPNIYALMKVCWKFEPRHRKDCSFVRDTINSWLEVDEPFIRESWKRLMLPPLSERRPTILKSKTLHRFIKRDITL